MSSRTAGNFLTKFTTLIAVLFIITSISLTIINKKEENPSSVLDEIEKQDNKDKNLPKIPKSN